MLVTKIFFEPNTDAFTQAAQLHNLPVFYTRDWWHCGAQQKRCGDPVEK